MCSICTSYSNLLKVPSVREKSHWEMYVWRNTIVLHYISIQFKLHFFHKFILLFANYLQSNLLHFQFTFLHSFQLIRLYIQKHILFTCLLLPEYSTKNFVFISLHFLKQILFFMNIVRIFIVPLNLFTKKHLAHVLGSIWSILWVTKVRFGRSAVVYQFSR